MTRAVSQDTKTKAAVHVGGEPNDEAVRLRAYEIYMARGAQPGREAEDWEQAKRELMTRVR